MKMSVADQVSHKKAIFLFLFLCLDPFLACFQLLPVMGATLFLCVYIIPFFITFLMFVYVSLSDPGYRIKKTGRHLLKLLDCKYRSITDSFEAIPDSPVLSSICFVCNIEKKKARHCDQCGRCVNKFDHHCPFLVNCVGKKNLRVFVSFLAVALVFVIGKFVFNIMARTGKICWYDSKSIFFIEPDFFTYILIKLFRH